MSSSSVSIAGGSSSASSTRGVPAARVELVHPGQIVDGRLRRVLARVAQRRLDPGEEVASPVVCDDRVGERHVPVPRIG